MGWDGVAAGLAAMLSFPCWKSTFCCSWQMPAAPPARSRMSFPLPAHSTRTDTGQSFGETGSAHPHRAPLMNKALLRSLPSLVPNTHLRVFIGAPLPHRTGRAGHRRAVQPARLLRCRKGGRQRVVLGLSNGAIHRRQQPVHLNASRALSAPVPPVPFHGQPCLRGARSQALTSRSTTFP